MSSFFYLFSASVTGANTHNVCSLVIFMKVQGCKQHQDTLTHHSLCPANSLQYKKHFTFIVLRKKKYRIMSAPWWSGWGCLLHVILPPSSIFPVVSLLLST